MSRRRDSENSKVFIGIDLGKTGGFVCINDCTELIKVAYPPYDYKSIFDFMQSLNKEKEVFIGIEDVLCYFGKGVYSIRYLSVDKGKWQMLFSLAGVSEKQIRYYMPFIWQRGLFGKLEKNKMKEIAFEFTKKTLKDYTPLLKKNNTPHEGLVDAYCVAYYTMVKRGNAYPRRRLS